MSNLKAHSRISMENLYKAIAKAHSRISMENLYKEIAERKRAEVAVAKERQRFYDVLETLPAYVVLLTPDYHVPFANRFFRERFGESHGCRCYEYLFKRTEPCEICETFTVLKTGKSHNWEWLGPDGRNYDIHDFPFTDTDGSPLIMEVGIDITEAKRAEAVLKEVNETLEQRVAERTAELRKSEESLRRQFELLEHAPVLVRNLNDEIILWNSGMENIYGYSRGEALGKVPHDLLQTLHPQPLAEIISHISHERQWEGELHHKGKDGKDIIVTSLQMLHRDADGNAAAIIEVNTDMTEHKRAEEALRQSEEKYRNILENMNDSYFETDLRGNMTFCNPMVPKSLGYSPEEMAGMNHRMYMDPENAEIVERSFRDVYRENIPSKVISYEVIKKDRTKAHVETSFSLIKNKDGHSTGYCGISRDITARKRSEEALQISEARYRKLFKSAQEGILILDADTGQVIDANPFMQDLLGYSWEEFVGKSLWDIGSFKDVAASKSSFDELQRKGYIRYEDLPIETSDGRHINVEFVSNVYMVDGKQVIQCNIRDITERKMAESEINEQIAELQRWQNATLGRETRILDLKREVNELLDRAGEPPRYPSTESQDKKKK